MASPKKKNKEHQQSSTPKKQSEKEVKASRLKYLFPLFGILLISFLTYFPVLHNGFVNLDDDYYVQNNPGIHFINLKEIFTSYVQGNYHPFTMLSYALQYHFYGLNETGYHAVNLVIHLQNVLLVFYAILLLSKKPAVALIASLLFGIHPLHVESVAWISELKDLLYSFFLLASYIFYLKFVRGKKEKFYFYSLILFLCSLFSKAMAASLPLVLLLTDHLMHKRIDSKMWIRKIPFFILSLIFGVIAIYAQQSSHAVGVENLSAFTFPQRIVFACYGFISYLIKLILPLNLSVYYPYPINLGESMPLRYYVYSVLFIALIFFAFYSLRRSKKIFFGIGFFAITIFLVLQLLPVGRVIMADRYSYIPSIGIFYLMAEGFYWLWLKRNEMTFLKLPCILAIVAVIIFFSVKTYSRCGVWKNSLTLWNDVIRNYKSIPLAYNNRGLILVKENRREEALKDYNLAIELQPDYDEAYYNRGTALIAQKRYEDALKDFNKAIEFNPKYSDAYNNRGILFETINNDENALRDYNKVIELKPDFAGVYVNRGNILRKQKRNEEAMNDYNHAILLNPRLAEAYYCKFILEYDGGNKDLGCSDLQVAVNLGLQVAIDEYKQYCH